MGVAPSCSRVRMGQPASGIPIAAKHPNGDCRSLGRNGPGGSTGLGTKSQRAGFEKNGGVGADEVVGRKENSAAAQTQALALPPGEERTWAIACVAPILMHDDPSGAFRLLGQLPEGEARKDSIRAVQLNWDLAGLRLNDPAAMATMLDSVPTGERQRGLVTSMVGQWAQRDPANAAQWLQRLPAGQERDSAIGTFVSNISARDPKSAIEWAKTVADANQRENLFQAIALCWKKSDPVAAEQ